MLCTVYFKMQIVELCMIFKITFLLYVGLSLSWRATVGVNVFLPPISLGYQTQDTRLGATGAFTTEPQIFFFLRKRDKLPIPLYAQIYEGDGAWVCVGPAPQGLISPKRTI